MRQVPRRFWMLSALLLVLNVAGLLWIRQELRTQHDPETGPLRVVSSLPREHVDQAERLSLVFNRPVGEPDKLNQRLEESRPFEVSPQVRGEWTWVTPKRLDFVLDDPLPPGKTFRVEPASGVDTQLGQVVQINNKIEFQTRVLELTECRLVSSDDSHVTFELKFNQPVAPNDLLTALRLSTRVNEGRDSQTADPVSADAGDDSSAPNSGVQSRLDAVSLINEPSDSIVVRCQRPESGLLIVELEAHLTGHNAELPLGVALRQELRISPAFAFLRTKVDDLGIDRFFQVDVYFTSGLDPDQRLPPFELSPPVQQIESMLTGTHSLKGRSLRLKGQFEAGRRYQLELPGTLLAQSGKTLGRKTRVTFDVPDREPQIMLSDRRGILSPFGNLNIEMQTLNVGNVKLRASRVHANNLVPHLHGQWKRRTSVSLAERAFQIDYPRNEEVPHTLDLRSLLRKPIGLYQISVDATDASWTRDSAVIAVTDLGLTMKQQRGRMHVWVTSLRHATSLAGVRVASISYNNQVLASGTTDDQGLVEMDVDRVHPDGLPWVILAEWKDQTAWLRTDQGHWVIDDIDQSGRSASETYDVLLYSERGTYRPGEVIHLTGIIRDNNGETPQPFPLHVRVIRPDGRTVGTETVQPTADAHGMFHLDWLTPKTAWTGPWRFQVSLPGDEDALTESHAYVEEFIPIRLELQARPTQRLVTDNEPRIDVTARYLFGTPASGLQVQAAGEFRATRFRSERYPDFTFGPRRVSQRIDPGTIDIRLDKAGRGRIDLIEQTPDDKGCWHASFAVTVAEDGGRSVSTHTDFDLDTLHRHLGIRLESGSVVSVGSDVNVEWTLRSAADQAAEFAPVSFELLRVEFDNVLRRNNGHSTWESIERTKSIWKQTVSDSPMDEIGLTTTTCPNAGVYRLIAVDSRTGRESVLQFRAVESGASSLSMALDRPERLSLKLDRTRYRPGDTANVVVTSPFAGNLWLCLESDRVLWSTVVRLDKNSAVVQVPIPQDLRGGAYVTGSVVRAVDPNLTEWLPHRARGMAHIVTDHSDRAMPIEIETPESVEPGTSVTIAVSAQPGAMIHLWAVDEGILATSGFATPNPHAHFFARRRNEVTSSDVFSRLLPDHRRPATFHRIGAGVEGTDPLRRNPVPTRQREAAVIWNTIRRADSNGRLTEEYTLPHLTGRLRWMAVGVIGDRYGSAESPINVTSPLLVEASWPRFAAPQDAFRVPARLFNTTDEPFSVKLETSVSGPLTLKHDDSTIVVAPRSSHVVWLTATATSIGSVEGMIHVVATSTNGTSLTSDSQFALPVRPATSLETDREFLTLKAGESHSLKTAPRFLRDTVRTRVTVSAQPGLDLQPAVDQLLEYPYGCVEQTTSQLRGILAARHWLGFETETAADDRHEAVSALVDAGVSRLWSMQTRSGGLSYWPGSVESHFWGTIYAAETLLDARDQGYAVDSRLLSSLQKFLEQNLHQAGNAELSDLNSIAELCCVLSRLDAPPTGWMSRLTERVDDLDMAGRAQLTLAWLHAGHRDRILESLPSDTIDLQAERSYSGRFASNTVQQARLLNVLLEVDPDHQWIPQLVTRLRKARRSGRWLSTLENAMVVNALSAQQAASGSAIEFSGRVTIGDESFELQPGATRVVLLTPVDDPFEVRAAGTGQVFATVETTGLAKNPPDERDRVIQVRRRWLDRHGEGIHPQQVRVGDLIVVEVTLKTSGRSSIESIAIVDALPAGLEVENPRLRTSDRSAFDSSSAKRVEFLDDRVLLFTTATPRSTTFRYGLRAVTEGAFIVPPIQASCMYNESIESIADGGRLVIGKLIERPGPLARDPDTKSIR